MGMKMDGRKGKSKGSKGKGRKYTAQEEKAVLETVAQHPGSGRYSGVQAAARATGVPYSTVQSFVDRNRSEVETLRQYNLERHIALLQDRAVMCVERAGTPALKPSEIRDYAVASGIFQDKSQLLLNRPTEIHAHLHAHRLEIHDLGKKLAIALSLIDGARGTKSGDERMLGTDNTSGSEGDGRRDGKSN